MYTTFCGSLRLLVDTGVAPVGLRVSRGAGSGLPAEPGTHEVTAVFLSWRGVLWQREHGS